MEGGGKGVKRLLEKPEEDVNAPQWERSWQERMESYEIMMKVKWKDKTTLVEWGKGCERLVVGGQVLYVSMVVPPETLVSLPVTIDVLLRPLSSPDPDKGLLVSSSEAVEGRREHEGWKGYTSRAGDMKLICSEKEGGLLWLGSLRCSLHGLAIMRAFGGKKLKPSSAAASPSLSSISSPSSSSAASSLISCLTGWSAHLMLRQEGASVPLVQRTWQGTLRLADVASEFLRLVSFSPHGGDGLPIRLLRPQGLRELRVCCDYVLYDSAGHPLCAHSSYLWDVRNRAFPVASEAFSLNVRGHNVRLTLQDAGDYARPETLVTGVFFELNLDRVREWLGRQDLHMLDLAKWLAAQPV